MAVELGARATLIAANETTVAAMQGHAHNGYFAFTGENWISDPKATLERALQYMGLTEGQSVQSIEIDTAFIGSCTNSRIEDLREASKILKGNQVAAGVQAIVIPGFAMTRIKPKPKASSIFLNPQGSNGDLLFYDDTMVLGDEDGSTLTIVEFKKPSRNDFRFGPAKTDPVTQVTHTLEKAVATGGITRRTSVPHSSQRSP